MRDVGPPRPLLGLRTAVRLWKLVGLVWLLPLAAAVPVLAVVEVEVSRRLADLTRCPATAGDAPLIALRAAAGAAGILAVALVGSLVAQWTCTVIWHAGTVGWWRAAGGGALRPGELVSLGVLRFWRYARLSGVALLAVGLGWCAVVVPLGWAFGRARHAMAEGTMMAVMILGLLLGAAWLGVGWCATLHGAWRLGTVSSRSAIRAWCEGLAATFRHPVASFGTVALGVALGLLSALAPLAAGWLVPCLRGGVAGVALGLVSSLLWAVAWVALLLAFAGDELDASPDGEASSL